MTTTTGYLTSRPPAIQTQLERIAAGISAVRATVGAGSARMVGGVPGGLDMAPWYRPGPTLRAEGTPRL